MKAKLPKKLQGIIPFFEEIEATDYRLVQSIGAGVVPVREFYGKKLSNKDFKIAKQLGMCGKCFGVHLADWFETKITLLIADWDTGFHVEGKLTDWTTLQHRFGTKRQVWPARGHADGAQALFKILARKAADVEFGDWLRAGRYRVKCGKYMALVTLQKYLREKCNAPYNCFGGDKWKTTRPSDVLKQVISRNFE